MYTDSDWSDEGRLRVRASAMARQSYDMVESIMMLPLNYVQANQKWYPLSKTVAERTAHQFAAANDIVLKACNPTYIFGFVALPYYQS